MVELEIITGEKNPIYRTALLGKYYHLNSLRERENHYTGTFCIPFWKILFETLNINPQSFFEVGWGGRENLAIALSKLGKDISVLEGGLTGGIKKVYKRKPSSWSYFHLYRRTRGYKEAFGKIKEYNGDIQKCLREDSVIKDKKFDFVYFWGSLFNHGTDNKSISFDGDYYYHSEEFLEAKITPVVNMISNGGCLMYTNSNLGSNTVGFTDKVINCNNMDLVKLAIWYSIAPCRKPNKITFIGLGQEDVLDINHKSNEILRLAHERIKEKRYNVKVPGFMFDLGTKKEFVERVLQKDFEKINEFRLYSMWLEGLCRNYQTEISTDEEIRKVLNQDLVRMISTTETPAPDSKFCFPPEIYAKLLRADTKIKDLIKNLPPMYIDLVVLKYD